MAKRLTPEQLLELLKSFKSGSTIDELSRSYKFTKLTISRNLKKNLGEQKYKELLISNKSLKNSYTTKKIDESYATVQEKKTYSKSDVNNEIISRNEESFSSITFMEIPPMDFQIENLPQKDLSSVPISDFDFPKIVYMIVDKKIELEIKLLKEFPEWEFLSQNELDRKTIEIHYDLQAAKRLCNKEQKVIKIPNTNVFRIVAPILISRGITRIVSSENLIAL